MPMNLLDIVVLLLLAGAVLNGLRRGFVLQIASLIGFVLALVIAFRFSADLANGLGEVVPVTSRDGETPSWLSFLPLDAVVVPGDRLCAPVFRNEIPFPPYCRNASPCGEAARFKHCEPVGRRFPCARSNRDHFGNRHQRTPIHPRAENAIPLARVVVCHMGDEYNPCPDQLVERVDTFAENII